MCEHSYSPPFGISLIYQTQVPHILFDVPDHKKLLLLVCLILLADSLTAIILVCLILLANSLTSIILFADADACIVHFYNGFYVLKHIPNVCT